MNFDFDEEFEMIRDVAEEQERKRIVIVMCDLIDHEVEQILVLVKSFLSTLFCKINR